MNQAESTAPVEPDQYSPEQTWTGKQQRKRLL